MVWLTLIARVADGLPLAEGLDTEKNPLVDQYKAQAKALFKKLTQSNNHLPRLSIDSNQHVFHYIIDSGTCFMTLTEKGYPKKLAFQYLEELCGEFGRLYGNQVSTVNRPYAFIKFDVFIQKTKKLYMDTRTQRNLAKLNDELSEVHSIMTKSISEVLEQGTKLDQMSQMSANLAAETRMYAKRSDDLHKQALVRKYMPIAVVVGIVLLLLLVRRFIL